MGLENELAYEREIRELREENARLKAEWEMPCQRCEGYRRERDEARAEVESLKERLSLVTEDYIRHRNALEAAERERDEARREVERLEGLILAWDDAPLTAADEAYDALTTEARRIRAQREEEQHRKHPTGDYCVWCHSQWPCEESSEEGR